MAFRAAGIEITESKLATLSLKFTVIFGPFPERPNSLNMKSGEKEVPTRSPQVMAGELRL